MIGDRFMHCDVRYGKSNDRRHFNVIFMKMKYAMASGHSSTHQMVD